MKPLPHSVIVNQNSSVENTEKSVTQNKGKQIVPDQLEDAALPDGHQFDEALEPFGRVMVTIGVNISQHFFSKFFCEMSE